MTYVSIIRIIFIFLSLTTSFAHSYNDKTNRIEVLVNENIITKYDIVQRLKINSILNRVEITDINYNQLLNIVIDDLVIEKLKIRKIEEYNISFNKNEFITHEKRYLLNLNFSKKELEELFYINDINYNHLNDLLGIDLKWQKLIYGLYFRVTSVTEQEISELTSKNPNIDEETANDLILQKQLDLKSKKLIKDLRDEATIEYK